MLIQEPFAEGTSPIHRLDPRFKIIFAALLSITVAVLTSIPALGASLLAAVTLAIVARLGGKAVIKRLSVVLGFIFLMWIFLPITYEGTAVFQIGSLSLSREGLLLSSRITLKSFSILIIFMALISTMTVATLGHALNQLRLPPKFVLLMLLNYRYIFVLWEEYQRLSRAIQIRAFQPGTNMHTYKTYAYLIGMLFVRATHRADRVNKAMRCRGFRGKFYSLQVFPRHAGNPVFALLMVVLVSALIAMECLA